MAKGWRQGCGKGTGEGVEGKDLIDYSSKCKRFHQHVLLSEERYR